MNKALSLKKVARNFGGNYESIRIKYLVLLLEDKRDMGVTVDDFLTFTVKFPKNYGFYFPAGIGACAQCWSNAAAAHNGQTYLSQVDSYGRIMMLSRMKTLQHTNGTLYVSNCTIKDPQEVMKNHFIL